jgi:GlpG protein
MRLIGTLEGRKRAEVFVAFLIAQKVRTIVETQAGATDVYEIWICDEDQVPLAKGELEKFRGAADLSFYEESRRKAEEVLREEQQRKAASAKNVQKIRYNTGGASGFWPPPITLALVVIASLVSLATDFGSPTKNNSLGNTLVNELMFISSANIQEQVADSGRITTPAASILQGEVWRVITPIFLHLRPLHLLFNLFALIPLGRIVERGEGTIRYSMFILAAAIIPNLMQGLLPPACFGSPLFGGLSGVAYALFGFLWVKTTLQPQMGIYFPTSTIILMMLWLVLGFTGQVGPIANMAHLGGLLVGLASGWLAVQFPKR